MRFTALARLSLSLGIRLLGATYCARRLTALVLGAAPPPPIHASLSLSGRVRLLLLRGSLNVLLYGAAILHWVLKNKGAQSLIVFLNWVKWPPAFLVDFKRPDQPSWLSALVYPGHARAEYVEQPVITGPGSVVVVVEEEAKQEEEEEEEEEEEIVNDDTNDDGHIIRGMYIPAQTRGESSMVLSSEENQGDAYGEEEEEEEEQGDVPNQRACLLYFHGNAATRFAGHRNEVYKLFSADSRFRGMLDVCAFDYRGFADSSKPKTEDGLPTETTLAEDARAAFRGAMRVSNLPSHRIIIFGHSLGSAASTRLVAELCDAGTPPAGLILEAPFTSIPNVVNSSMYSLWGLLPSSWIDQLQIEFPNIDRIHRVTCPAMIVHGKRDDLIPPSHGKALMEKLPDGDAHKQFVLSEKAGHDNCLAQAEVQSAVCKFIVSLMNASS